MMNELMKKVQEQIEEKKIKISETPVTIIQPLKDNCVVTMTLTLKDKHLKNEVSIEENAFIFEPLDGDVDGFLEAMLGGGE